MPTGLIKRLMRDKGFGFIEPSGGGADVFFHHTMVADRSFDRLTEGQPVEFDLATDDRSGSGIKATAVRPGKRPIAPPRDALSPLRRHPRALAKKPTWREAP
jgi:CspA family cold shock protein